MRKVIYWVHTSIDGFIAGPNGEFDWPLLTPELSEYSDLMSDRVGVFLYGRVVWDLMSGYWPTADQVADDPHSVKFAPIWRETPKVVFSRTLTEAGWNARVTADLEGTVRALRAEDGKDMVLTGGAETAAALASHDLIDEYQVVVHPVVLGGGKRIFPVAERLGLRLAETRAFDDRAVLLSYRRS
ncbi:dihydrofolate reductase family protein [Actinophytocola oryzae]|uniref:Dihydrofolate reductase n=1 Tax=Actinophytocola oryzae TaxID=502181 RepID=A0A4R7V123_9PSEU|nr:dihydrofolate reductase family protein [Actinophytocola oryzae]TDV42264.1 dihydrofolate reductase [Actinophytocola oryzae]